MANLVPVPEILSEIVGSGVASQGLVRAYDRTTALLGADFTVLEDAPFEDIARVNPRFGEAVNRLRAGTVIRQAGYDGEYGVIRLFEEGELDRLTRGALLFDAPPIQLVRVKHQPTPPTARIEEPAAPLPTAPLTPNRTGALAALDADQARAAEAVGPLIVVAGPGSGKTRMLTHRPTEAGFWDARAERVSLLTMHAAKGLEFPVAFVVGLEGRLVPFSWKASDDAAGEERPDAEERRLFYVAMTRAKDRLFFSRALERTWRGERRALPPSPLLSDIAAEPVTRQMSITRKRSDESRKHSLL